jgi:very-short-patch-repair endonuclease
MIALSRRERVGPSRPERGEGELHKGDSMSKSKGHFILPAILQRSRDLRHPLTPSEAKIWNAVRSRQLGFKIRRQQPIGRFILDFYCAEAKLAIEIDGDIHTDPDQAAYDAARTQWLEERGYAVIRFEANQVDEHLPDVLDAIREACESRSAKAPLSRRETIVPGA